MTAATKPSRGLQDLDDIDAVFEALAHHTRRHVLQVLAARDDTLTAGELARRFEHAWPTTTRHLGVLRDAGLVSVTPEGRERHYRLERQRLGDVLALWLRGVGFELPGVIAALAKRRPHVTNMDRLERIVADLPEAERVDIAEWGDHPTFRVRGKNFVFCDADAHHLTVKLSHDEAAAVVETEPIAEPAGYGLGRHGWISVRVPLDADESRWQQVREWVRTSYTLVAPKRLARLVTEVDEEVRAERR